MSANSDCIVKSGVVERIDNQVIYVKVLTTGACVSCHAKGACTSLDTSERLIEIDQTTAPDVKSGQIIQVSMKNSNGNLAVVYGYVIPFLIVIISLLFLISMTTEGIAGLLSIALLMPYYLILYLMKNRLRKRFMFTIEQ